MKFDTVFFNGKFCTMKQEGDVCQAVAVENGKIAKVFSVFNKNEVFAKKFVDMNGCFVTPGLIDSHVHFLSFAILQVFGIQAHVLENGTMQPDTLQGLLKKIEVESVNAQSPFVLFFGFNASCIAENRLPTKQEVDEVSNGKMIAIYTTDGHSSSLNSKLLKKLGKTSEDGVFEGSAHECIQGHVTGLMLKQVNLSVLAKGLARGVNEAARHGVTTLCALEGFDELKKDSSFSLCMFLFPRLPLNIRVFPQFKNAEKVKKFYKKFLHPRLGGCGSWELDGAVGSHSAAFEQDYLDRKNCKGKLYNSTQELCRQVSSAQNLNANVGMHAIGECAISQALDVLEQTKCSQVFQHRIEHFEFPSKRDVQRAIDSKINIVVQPGYSWFDKKFFHSYEKFLTPKLICQQLPLKTLVSQGVNVCGGSDAPVQEISPFLQMHGMTNFYIDEQSLTPFEAFCTYTKNGGKMLDEITGVLEVGANADFAVFDVNPFNKNFLDTMPIKTYIAGKEFVQMKETVFSLTKLLWAKSKKI